MDFGRKNSGNRENPEYRRNDEKTQFLGKIFFSKNCQFGLLGNLDFILTDFRRYYSEIQIAQLLFDDFGGQVVENRDSPVSSSKKCKGPCVFQFSIPSISVHS